MIETREKVMKLNSEEAERNAAILREVSKIENAVSKVSVKDMSYSLGMIVVTEDYVNYLFNLLLEVPFNYKEANPIRDIVHNNKFYSEKMGMSFKIVDVKDINETGISDYMRDMCVLAFPGRQSFIDNFILSKAYMSKGNDFVEVMFDEGVNNRYLHSCEKYYEQSLNDILDNDFYNIDYTIGFTTCEVCGMSIALLPWSEETFTRIKMDFNEVNSK